MNVRQKVDLGTAYDTFSKPRNADAQMGSFPPLKDNKQMCAGDDTLEEPQGRAYAQRLAQLDMKR